MFNARQKEPLQASYPLKYISSGSVIVQMYVRINEEKRISFCLALGNFVLETKFCLLVAYVWLWQQARLYVNLLNLL